MGSDLGEGEEEQTFFSLLSPQAALGSRPDTAFESLFSKACYPEVGGTSDGHMECICGKLGQLWQDFRYEYIPSDSAISLYPRKKLFSQRETHLQVILQGHGKIGVSPGTQTLKWREAASCCE